MDLRDATRMILSESAPYPELMRVTQAAHDELSFGRPVDHTVLNGILREAARKGLFSGLRAKYGVEAFEDMVTVLAKEIDRQAPVVRR
jgi:hypothetical protein